MISAALVNLEFVEEIVRIEGGAYEVRMRDAAGTRLPVSRSARAKLNLSQ